MLKPTRGFLEKLEEFNKYLYLLKPEAIEQARLVLHLEERAYTYTAIPNSTFTKSWKQKIVNKITGLKPGLCDMLVVLKRGSLLFVEMKLPHRILLNGEQGATPSSISKDQRNWIEILDSIDNVSAVICYGYKEAIETIEAYENL